MKTVEWIDFCINQHDVVCNQKYDTILPYSQHLIYVDSQHSKWSYLINEPNKLIVRLAIYGHDLIEDARITYNDIKDKMNVEIADIIYCCTEEKGKNRDERHSQKYYDELAKNKLAIYVKLCDIMANVTYSILTNSSMYDKHKKENTKTQTLRQYAPEYGPMFDYLNKLFELK